MKRPAGSWEQAAPVFAKGDFCRDGGKGKTLSALAILAMPPVAAFMFSVPRHVPHS